MPRLSNLLTDARITPVHSVGDLSRDISAVTADSRAVTAHALFVAIPGVKNDGAQYIDDAVNRGAAAIVRTAQSTPWNHPSALVEVEDTRAAIALLSAAFYPTQPEYLFAITGTDGKTSTADFTRQLATLLGHKTASIGTLGLRSGDATRDAQFPANNTSPEPVLLHRTLQTLANAGITMVAIEASSHGLDQKRLEGVKFSAAAFTNLTRDHLDYHGTAEAYAAAKTRLFSELLPPASVAILNHDDAQFEPLRDVCKSRRILVRSFGTHAAADYRIVAVTPHARGLDAKITLDHRPYTISLPLYGAFQLSNIVAAIGLLHSTGIAPDDLVALLPKLQGVPGRLEKVATAPCDAPIFVDYAHTPAALENILKTLRAHTKNKLHVVFGCGGDRDAGKRPEMGRAAAQYADCVIVTDDNPRSENPATIRAAIMAGIFTSPLAGEVDALLGASGEGMRNKPSITPTTITPTLPLPPHGGGSIVEIPGRDAAIREAVKQLRTGDVLVVAGKGHEHTQIIGEQTIHFSDAEQVQQSVRDI